MSKFGVTSRRGGKGRDKGRKWKKKEGTKELEEKGRDTRGKKCKAGIDRNGNSLFHTLLTIILSWGEAWRSRKRPKILNNGELLSVGRCNLPLGCAPGRRADLYWKQDALMT